MKTNNILLGSTVLMLLLFVGSCKNDNLISQNNNEVIQNTNSHFNDRNVDVNGDNKIDYQFLYFAGETGSSSWTGLYVHCLDSNEVQNSSISGTLPIENNGVISDTSGWSVNSESIAGAANNSSYWSGPFVGDSSKFLGIRLYNEGKYYYGYLKISITHNGALSIIDSAYSKVANQQIHAGDNP